MKEINSTFQKDWNKIEELLKYIVPDISDRDLGALKVQCRCMVVNVIHGIGNGVNGLTSTLNGNY